jgi:hypothetical protein
VAIALRVLKRSVTVAILTLASAVTSAQTNGVTLPAPIGLNLCKDNDSVASTEKRVAPTIGAEYLACFVSDEKVALHGTSRTISPPLEYAFAMRVLGGPYGRKDLEAMLSAAREQWKNATPQFSQHGDYLTWLNSLISGPYSRRSTIESVKPVLVSIDRIDDHSYVIVTIREYAIAVNSDEFRSIKATTSAIVLQEPQLVRLSIQRELRAPSDVEDVRKQIAAWSRAVAEGSTKSTRP